MRSNQPAAHGGAITDVGVGDLKLARRERVAVAAHAVGVGQQDGQPPQPALEELAYVPRSETVADLLQHRWLLARREPVIELEGDRLASRLGTWPTRAH